jgi:hypothetical protein
MVFLRLKRHVLRDRPCNLKGRVMVLCFVQNFFFGQHKRYNIYILCRAKREICFQNLTFGYDKNSDSNHIIFFSSSTKIRIFFSATLGIRIFFLEKNHNPSFKLNGRSLNCFIFSDYDSLRDVRKKTTEWLILIKKKK